MGDSRAEDTKRESTGTEIWKKLGFAAAKFATGLGATAIATRIVPEAVETTTHGVQMLLPMGRFATNASLTAEFAGNKLTKANPWLAGATMMLHSTNNTPGSSAETEMMRISNDARRRQEAYAAANAANVALAHARMASQAAAASRKPSAFQLKRPDILNTQAANEAVRRNRNTLTLGKPAILSHPPPTVGNRLEPLKLRPAQTISTPFNVRLMRPPVSANPFNLSVMGRPSGSPFGLHL